MFPWLDFLLEGLWCEMKWSELRCRLILGFCGWEVSNVPSISENCTCIFGLILENVLSNVYHILGTFDSPMGSFHLVHLNWLVRLQSWGFCLKGPISSRFLVQNMLEKTTWSKHDIKIKVPRLMISLYIVCERNLMAPFRGLAAPPWCSISFNKQTNAS